MGGFGNICSNFKFLCNDNLINSLSQRKLGYTLDKALNSSNNSRDIISNKFKFKGFQLGSYLAGLIEGDGTLAVQIKNSKAKKYSPKIIIAFKKADLPLANYLQTITNCGKVYIKPNRVYILWQIQDLVSVYIIINLINGYMRTPKIEALIRMIN